MKLIMMSLLILQNKEAALIFPLIDCLTGFKNYDAA
jgi:hypothetical protein